MNRRAREQGDSLDEDMSQLQGRRNRRIVEIATELRSPNSGLLGQAVRFLLAGGLVAAIYICTTLFLRDIVGLNFQVALAIGFSTGLLVQFNLYRVFVWVNHDGFALSIHHQAGRFLLAAAFGYGTTAICTAFLPSLLDVPTELVYLAMVITLPIFNFTILRHIIFHSETRDVDDALSSEDAIQSAVDPMCSISLTSRLIHSVFPSSDIQRQEYLHWLYEQSPFGTVIEANLDDKEGRAGHYALVPITLACDGVDSSAALSLNTAVHERARGSGVFLRLATEAINEARRQEIGAVVGVANANSTPGFVRRLGFELVGELPANLIIPVPGSSSSIRSGWAEAGAFAEDGLARGCEPLLMPPDTGQARSWTTAALRWRLARPGAHYALHRSDDLLAISCADSRRGMRVAIILKVFAATPLDRARQRGLVRSACAFHRAPLALHVGFSDLVDFGGIALPKHLRESPLNLIYLSLRSDSRPAPIARFEFLDFDAY